MQIPFFLASSINVKQILYGSPTPSPEIHNPPIKSSIRNNGHISCISFGVIKLHSIL